MSSEQSWGPYLRALREGAATNGRCTGCRARPPRPGKRKCQFCVDSSRDCRERKIEEGMCRELCGRPKATGRVRCDPCLARARVYKQRHTEKKRQLRAAQVSSAPAVPPTCLYPTSTDGPPKADSGQPAGVDLFTRRDVIAAMARRRTA